MTRLLWTPLSLQDLQDISAYIEANRDLATANRVCRAIYEAAQLLRRYPETGKPGLEEGTRELVVPAYPAYVITYRTAAPERIEVLRIWHGAQQRQS